jgi:hypothetical protein
MQPMKIPFSITPSHIQVPHPYLNLRASRSDSRRQRISSSRTIGSFVSSQSSCFLLWRPKSLDRNRLSILENRTWALDVADDGSGGIVHELDSDLSDTSTGTYSISYQPPAPSSHIPSVGNSNIPVRPKTRVTLTNLTGTFEESMFAICTIRQHEILRLAQRTSRVSYLKNARRFWSLR